MRGDTAIGHVDAHNELRDGILREASRFGTTVDIGGPFVVGDPGHIPQHNKLVVALQAIADLASIKVVLPPAHKLGDTGHVTDHDKLNLALAAIAKADAWNDATGGTISDYTLDGKRWRAHTFTDPTGTFTVKRAARSFEALVVGGGGGSAGAYVGKTGGSGGGGAVIYNTDLKLPIASYPVTVGGGGPGGDTEGHDGAGMGGESTFAALKAGGGGKGGAYFGPSSAGGPPNGGHGGNFEEYGGGGSYGNPDLVCSISGASVTYGVGGGWVDGNGGATMPPGRGLGGQSHRGGPGDQGGTGVVIVRYQIGVAA